MAVTAAYAVAMQVLLAGFLALPQAASADIALHTLCASSPQTTPIIPHRACPDGACCLAAGCGSLAPAVVPMSAVAHPLVGAAGRLAVASGYRDPPLWPSERPSSSRAPPA